MTNNIVILFFFFSSFKERKSEFNVWIFYTIVCIIPLTLYMHLIDCNAE